MDGYQFYKIYSPIHLHFNSSYDLFKYGSKSRTINRESYERSKFQTRFAYYGSRFDSNQSAFTHCVAEFVYGSSDWLYHSWASDASDIWHSINHDFVPVFKSDLELVNSYIIEGKVKNFKALLEKTPSGNNAPLLQLCTSKRITYETIIVLNDWFHLFDKWSETIDPLAQRQLGLMKKYSPFLMPRINKGKLVQVMKEIF